MGSVTLEEEGTAEHSLSHVGTHQQAASHGPGREISQELNLPAP